MIGIDYPFFYLGQWKLMMHDHGWLIVRRGVVQLEGRWPTHRTFRRRRSA